MIPERPADGQQGRESAAECDRAGLAAGTLAAGLGDDEHQETLATSQWAVLLVVLVVWLLTRFTEDS